MRLHAGHVSLILLAVLLALQSVIASGCVLHFGAKKYLSIQQLRDLEQCVIDAEDQVERQNCVEQFIPSDAK